MDAFLQSFAPDNFSWESSLYSGSPWWIDALQLPHSHVSTSSSTSIYSKATNDKSFDVLRGAALLVKSESVDFATGRALAWTTSLFAVVAQNALALSAMDEHISEPLDSTCLEEALSNNTKAPLVSNEIVPQVSLPMLSLVPPPNTLGTPALVYTEPINPELPTTARPMCMWGRRLERVPKLRLPGQAAPIYCFDPNRQNNKFAAMAETRQRGSVRKDHSASEKHILFRTGIESMRPNAPPAARAAAPADSTVPGTQARTYSSLACFNVGLGPSYAPLFKLRPAARGSALSGAMPASVRTDHTTSDKHILFRTGVENMRPNVPPVARAAAPADCTIPTTQARTHSSLACFNAGLVPGHAPLSKLPPVARCTTLSDVMSTSVASHTPGQGLLPAPAAHKDVTRAPFVEFHPRRINFAQNTPVAPSLNPLKSYLGPPIDLNKRFSYYIAF